MPKLIRFLFSILSLATLINIASAQDASSPFIQQNMPFYISVSGGVAQTNFDLNYQDLTSENTFAQNIITSEPQSGGMGTVAVGYNTAFRNLFLLGVELSASSYQHHATFDPGAVTTGYNDIMSINHTYEASLLPGILFSPTLGVYFRGGVSIANISDQLTSPTGYFGIPQTYSDTQNDTGFVVGVGLKKYFTSYFSLFVEYDYRYYNNINFSNFQHYQTTYSHTETLSTNAMTTGVALNF